MVVNHSVKLSFDLRFTRLCLKNCMLKKPITRQHKLRLSCNSASTAASFASLCFLFPKSSSILFGSPVLLDGSGWFPPRLLSARQLRSIQLRGAIVLCALTPAREYAIRKINVRQKSTDNFHACTLALYHIYLFKSIEIKTFVCNVLYYLVILIAIVYTTNLLAENISLIIYNL